MIDRKLVQRFALAAAAHARVAAMQAENDTCRFKGQAPAFDAISFEKDIAHLEAIAGDLCEALSE